MARRKSPAFRWALTESNPLGDLSTPFLNYDDVFADLPIKSVSPLGRVRVRGRGRGREMPVIAFANGSIQEELRPAAAGIAKAD